MNLTNRQLEDSAKKRAEEVAPLLEKLNGCEELSDLIDEIQITGQGSDGPWLYLTTRGLVIHGTFTQDKVTDFIECARLFEGLSVFKITNLINDLQR